jgi:hypothetical protein
MGVADELPPQKLTLDFRRCLLITEEEMLLIGVTIKR